LAGDGALSLCLCAGITRLLLRLRLRFFEITSLFCIARKLATIYTSSIVPNGTPFDLMGASPQTPMFFLMKFLSVFLVDGISGNPKPSPLIRKAPHF